MHQSESQRSGCTLLGTIPLAKYSYKQTKSLEQLQRTTINTSENRASLKFYELTLSHTFASDTLITNFQICLNDERMWKMIFQFNSAEANCISNRGHYISMSNVQAQRNQNSILIDACAFSQSLKFIITLKKDFQIYCEDIIQLKKQKTKNIQQQNITKVLAHVISSIKIYGFNLHTSPHATQLTKLLNISQCFSKNKRYEEEAQTDIMLALCLINARRFIQASQLLRKTSRYFVRKYNSSKSHLESSKYERSWMKQCEEQNFQESLNMSRNYSTGRVLQGAKYLFRAAKIQLMLAQTISHPSLRGQKLEAYNRSNSYFNGNPNPVPLEPSVDIEEIFFKIGPNMLVFLMKVLYDKTQILRITALKSIQFIYETVGCSLSQMIPQILKTIMVTYPSNQSQQIFAVSHPLGSGQKEQKDPALSNQASSSSKNKTLIDSYHHLLETFIGLVPLMNKKYLRMIFKDTIIVNIGNNNSSIKNQLKLYLLRFSQKILSLCLSDLDITTPFLSAVISLSEKKIPNSGASSKYTIHNMSFFAQRIIELLKIKILPKYDNSEHLISLCNWINQNLVYFCQNEITQQNMQFFSTLIDFVSIIYNCKPTQKLPYLIEPIIYFLNMSISQQFLPFQSLLKVTITLLKYVKLKNGSSQISHEIVGRILTKSKIVTLNIKELKILQSVLLTFDVCQVEWLIQFLECIPHSTFDEIYGVFSILFQKSLSSINKPTLQRIINTLLDQYTVKGKAHESSKNSMIELIKTRNQSLIKFIFEICLTENSEPIYQSYEARKKRQKQHIVDTKLYKIHYELFVQKLELFVYFLNKNQMHSKELYKLLSADFIKIIYYSLKKLMESKSSKIKQKCLRIIKSLNQIVSDNIKVICKTDLFYTKAMISILKNFISQQIQSKLQYQAVINIGMIFNQILKPQQIIPLQSTQQSQIDFMDGNIQSHTQFQLPSSISNIQTKISDIRFRQFVKIYPVMVNLLSSPWENIKEIILETIVQFFVKGIAILSQNYQRKAIQLLKPLLANYMQSADYSQRFGACKIIGCLIGLSRDYKSREQMAENFAKATKYIKIFFTEIFNMSKDWYEPTAKVSKLILQISLSLQEQESLKKKIQNWKKTQQLMQSSYCTFNLNDEYNTFENRFEKNSSSFSINNFENLQNLLKDNSRFQDQNKNQSRFQQEYVEINDKIQQQIGFFKAEVQKTHNLRTSFFGDKQSFFVDREQNYLEPNQDKADSVNQDNKQNKSQQEPLQFEDLGIIDLDDQQWGEEENEVKITQKLPLKKIYKLSPNVGSSNKHQRIRSKRYFSHEYEQNDRIIVDQLQGRINHDSERKMQKFKPEIKQKLQKNSMEQFQKGENFQKDKKVQTFTEKYEFSGQSESFGQKQEQNQSFDLKVESKDEIPAEKSYQRVQQSHPIKERTSANKKVKKTTKKRKSSILK